MAAVIVERGAFAQRRRMLRFRLRRLGLARVLGQSLLVAYDRAWIRRSSKRAILAIMTPFGEAPEDLAWHSVPTINSRETRRLLRRHRPDLCVVTGTSIIRDHILREAPQFLNIHCGITPAYRGVHGAFWAIHERDFANVGVTVHRIDRGVDTGGIAAQARIEVAPETDTMRTLVAKQYAAGIPLMLQAVRDGLDAKLTTYKRDDLQSRQWFAPTFGDYVRFRRIMRSLSSRS